MINWLIKAWNQRGWLHSYFFQIIKGDIGLHALTDVEPPLDFMILIANHFEPRALTLGTSTAVQNIVNWCNALEELPIRDHDGFPFRHTYFFPAEQYSAEFLVPLEEHCRKGFGEVEVHLHHGVAKPDNAENLRHQLQQFVKNLRSHGFLSYDRDDPVKAPRYSFVHGNWALANSAGGKFCGVDEEMEILFETGCYMDCTLPSAPHIAQVNKINSIYQCGYPLSQRAPHRDGQDLSVGDKDPLLPILLQGPLLLNWKHIYKRIPFPGIENGVIHDYSPPTVERFRHWAAARIHVVGRTNWIFIKLHTHALRDDHAKSTRGPFIQRFLADLLRIYNDGDRYRLHFTTARESANIIFAALDGKVGNPGDYRDYRFKLFQS